MGASVCGVSVTSSTNIFFKATVSVILKAGAIFFYTRCTKGGPLWVPKETQLKTTGPEGLQPEPAVSLFKGPPCIYIIQGVPGFRMDFNRLYLRKYEILDFRFFS